MNKTSLLSALAFAPLALSLARAQSEEEVNAIPQLDPVIVTGTHLPPQKESESSHAVIVLDRQQIDQSGARTLNELIQRLPQNARGTNENQNVGVSFTPGAAGAALRGLSVTATLVLLNGRRVTPFPFPQGGADTFIDLNSIPLSAIERVEVLKEGASAIYGSDAIAGVINIITKQRFSGLESESYYGNTTDRDAGLFRQSFASGIQTEKLDLFLTGNYQHRNSLASRDRPFSADTDKRPFGGIDFSSSSANPGVIVDQGNFLAVPKGSDGRLAVGDFLSATLPDGTLRNRYNYNRDNELIAESERWGGLLTFRYEIAPQVELFGEASYQSVQTKMVISPTPITSSFDNLNVPAGNPFNPFGREVGFDWLAIESGRRLDTMETDAYRYLAGLRLLELPGGWRAEAAFLYSENNSVNYSTDGYLSTARTQAALNDTDPRTALNVFGDGLGINNPETLRNIAESQRVDARSHLYSVDVKASGPLFTLPAGPVEAALGAEYREEYMEFFFSRPLGSIIGFGGGPSVGDRDVRSLFFEARIPIASEQWNIPFVRGLELSVAERLDDYSDFGTSVRPRFSLRWKPVDSLTIRGSYAEGFRAPSLPQLFTGEVRSFSGVVNPQTGAFDETEVTSGGNRELDPETSYSYMLGAVFEPPCARGLRLGLDFYRIEQRNLIASPNPQDVADGRVPGIVRYGTGDDILEVQALYSNLGEVIVEGVDAEVSYQFETRFGAFTLSTAASYIHDFRQAATPGAELVDFTDSFALPEFRLISSLFYKCGGFEAGVTVNYTDSYDDRAPTPAQVDHTVGSWTTVDLQVSYEWPEQRGDEKGGPRRWRWLDGSRLTVGCLNVSDSEPPFVHSYEGYDPQTADAAGRFIYASFRKKLW
jgi:iron complex outermembrane receptor protein